MNLTSKDIKKRDFKKALRGYDNDEVDAFLETVSSHYEKLVVETKNLNEKIKSLQSDIDVYKENEANLQKALIKSQDLGEEIIENAKKRSEIIIKEAELNARKIKQDLDDEILSKRQELETIKQKNEKTFDDVRDFLNEKLNDLEDFIKNRKILKMELTSMKNTRIKEYEENEETENEKESENEDNANTDSPRSKGRSFDDSFEVKH